MPSLEAGGFGALAPFQMKNLAKNLEFPARQKPGGLTLPALVLLPGRDRRDRGHGANIHTHVQGTRGRTAVLAHRPAGPPPASLLTPTQPGEFGQLPGRSDPPTQLLAVGAGRWGSSAPPNPSAGPPHCHHEVFPRDVAPVPHSPSAAGKGPG